MDEQQPDARVVISITVDVYNAMKHTQAGVTIETMPAALLTPDSINPMILQGMLAVMAGSAEKVTRTLLGVDKEGMIGDEHSAHGSAARTDA